MKKIKKYTVISLLLLVTVIITLYFTLFDKRTTVLLSWGIYLPKPVNTEYIYLYEFRVGQDFYIWKYNDSGFYKVVSNKHFRQITENDINILKERIDEYYATLDEEEKQLFDENVNKEELLSTNNYYFQKTKEDPNTFMIIIANEKENQLYFFVTVC